VGQTLTCIGYSYLHIAKQLLLTHTMYMYLLLAIVTY